jgi:hypothetical protein
MCIFHYKRCASFFLYILGVGVCFPEIGFRINSPK